MPAGPTGSVILGLYEQGMTASPATRAALLARAGGATADATLGDADRAAWGFLTDHFGAAQDAVLTCSACGEDVEFTLPPGFAPPTAEPAETIKLDYDGHAHALRPPRLSDLASGALDLHALCPEGDWSDPGFRAACQAALLEADPALSLDLSLTCAAWASR